MTLKKLSLKPGINREGTSYSTSGTWFDGDKVRFRSGLPEKIGGWGQFSPNQYIGTCRSLWVWLDGDSGVGNLYVGLGTSSKYYIYNGGTYNDITPISQTSSLTNPFSATSGSKTITVTDATYAPNVGDYVIFTSTTTVGGLTISGEYVIASISGPTTYTITANTAAGSTGTGGGTVTASYEYPTGGNSYSSGLGWGAGPWGGPLTPITYSLNINPFAITSSSSTVTVTQAAHGMPNGTYVAFSGSSSVGNINATVLNSTYQISGVTTNTYNITLPSGLTATSTTTGGGGNVKVTEQSPLPVSAGSFVVGKQYIIEYVGTTDFTLIGASSNTIGVTFTATGVGSGTGQASLTTNRPWGTPYSSGVAVQLRLWSNDNYGADLLLAPRGGSIFYWQDQNTVSTRAQYLSTLANNTTLISGDTTSFSSGSTSITVSSANAPYIYPFSYITGTGIPANTYIVTINNVTGVATISQSTTAASTGTYSYSYSGAFVPSQTYQVISSEVQQFVLTFGSNPYVPNYASGTGISTFNPLLVRWSDQGNAYQWVPEQTNQAGEYTLTNGSFIMGARATRQEILVWTDSAIYSMQYIGAPYVWGFQLLMDNISIMSPNCMITVNNVTYWMGRDRFYLYDGTVKTLPCALKQYIYDDINQSQNYQIFAGANEGFNEIWWFYVSNESTTNIVDRYVVYNYLENIWYYGSMSRNAWYQTGVQQYPIASTYYTNALFTGSITGNTLTVSSMNTGSLAVGQILLAPGIVPNTTITALGTGTGGVGTYTISNSNMISSQSMSTTNGNGVLLNHEFGTDDLSTNYALPINSYITSSDIEISPEDAGQHFGFVWRMLPDVNFTGSNTYNTQSNPQVTIKLLPRQNSGSPYTSADAPNVLSSQAYGTPSPSEYVVQEFTGQVYTRLRGRQMAFTISSNQLGVAWQLGTPRFDIRPDGRR